MKLFFNWSSGKDSALALHELFKNQVAVDQLVTTINGHFDRVTMHGLRRDLLQAQAESIGIPLSVVELPKEPSMEEYGTIIQQSNASLIEQGYSDCAFGDIYLEDLRAYREKLFEGLTCHFPIWKRDTRQLIERFITDGFKAVILCVDTRFLDASFAGREIDQDFLRDLPDGVDPCGENGEFHTFCYEGPIFKFPVAFKQGEKTTRSYEITQKDGDEVRSESAEYVFLDLLIS